MKTFFREFLITIVVAAIICFAFQAALQTFIIHMSSMEPSFYEGQRLLVNKASYFFSDPERGDVIIFVAPKAQGEDYIKRIIALPGDTVEIKNEVVYVNGADLDEPYIKASPQYTMKEQEIPENSYFVLGDNRNNSNDSHHGWLVPQANIIGKAWLFIWPPKEWATVPKYYLAEQLTGF
ncbi:signal peptidase I [Chloroflexota bacterium]